MLMSGLWHRFGKIKVSFLVGDILTYCVLFSNITAGSEIHFMFMCQKGKNFVVDRNILFARWQ